MSDLPAKCQALICHDIGKPLKLESIETPQPGVGSVVVKVLAALVEPNFPDILSGKAGFASLTTPFTPGGRAIGRIAATGPDTTVFKTDQLVLTDPWIQARDDPDVNMFLGTSDGGSPASKILWQYWRQGVWSQYVKIPLENCHKLNESLLEQCSAADLLAATMQLVPYSGFRDIGLKAGETVIVAPATGLTSGAAVEVASAMGARVIAASRNIEKLQKLAKHNPRVHPVQLTGNDEEDMVALQKFGKADAYLDLSPFVKTTHVKPCIMSLRKEGRVSMMGGSPGDFNLPNFVLLVNNLTIRGRVMYGPEVTRDFVKLVNAGCIQFGKQAGHELVGKYGLKDWQAAFEAVEKTRDAGRMVVLTPFGEV